MRLPRLLLAASLGFAGALPAQGADEAPEPRIPMTVDVAAVRAAHGDRAADVLQGRLLALITEAGGIGLGTDAIVTLAPTVTVLESRLVETGVTKLQVVKLDVAVATLAGGRRSARGARTVRVAGSGSSREDAIVNALDQLSGDDKGWADYLGATQAEVVQAYERDCAAVLRQARTAAARGDTATAFTVLVGVPVSARTCHARTTVATDSIVAIAQRRRCDEVMGMARRGIALGDVIAAATAISGIPASAPCAREATGLVQEMDRRVRAERQAATEMVTAVARAVMWRERVTPVLASPAQLRDDRLTAARRSAGAVYRGEPTRAMASLWPESGGR
ncbi:MAG: hypothetical protein MUF53_04045 [Gemmatimonadaceae bacterium]|jgi:hypothetical protein|nr:hypothetical protein [Gemmatimonadaceae bacterium]